MALDVEQDTRLQNLHQLNQILSVTHLESSYNYRNIGTEFKLATSILSNNDKWKNLEIISQAEKPNRYSVVEEKICSDPVVHFVNIHAKKQRVYAALLQIKTQLPIETAQEEFFNFFTHSIANEQVNIEKIKPSYCRGINEAKMRKPACADCNQVCLYPIESVLSTRFGLTQNELLEELKRHHHPSSRKIGTHFRTTKEAARELANHYIFAHNLTEPEFL